VNEIQTIKLSLSTLSKREKASYRKGEMDIIIGKKQMHKIKPRLRSNRNNAMVFLIKSLAKSDRIFMFHNGRPSSTTKGDFLSAYRDLSITNDKNLSKIMSGEKILHFNTESVDIPARPQL